MHPEVGLAIVAASLLWLLICSAVGRASMKKRGEPPRTSILWTYVAIIGALLIAAAGLILEVIAAKRLTHL